MTTHADQAGTASVAARVADLSYLPMERLWSLWDEYFDDRPHHPHRIWLESRLAYRIPNRGLFCLGDCQDRSPDRSGPKF